MITLVVGAQYGGEGKGKISAFLATQEHFSAVCRTGSVNSKHTVVYRGETYDLRQLPTPAALGFSGTIVFGAGSLIHIPTLQKEMKMLNVDTEQVIIDPQAGILADEHTNEQRNDIRYKKIGSTMTGTGYATAQRALRKLSLAREHDELKGMIGPASETLWKCVQNDEHVLVEGHQSVGLSNYHGDYPYVSNRDSVAAELLSELGLGPRLPLRIILVVKAFPTRNHNGRLPNEMSMEEADGLGIYEYGGGSWGIENNRRRVGRIDLNDVSYAARLNTPTEIALTGVDYLEPTVQGSTSEKNLTENVWEFIHSIEQAAGVPVSMVSTGPETSAVVYRKDVAR